MLFGNKKNGKGKIPVEEAKKLSEQGLGDKEIIDRLRKEGYSFEEIQKAMLELVKGSVDEPPMPSIPNMVPPPNPLDSMQGNEEVFEEMPEEIDESDIGNPEDIVEELVEGVVEEKIKVFDEKLSKLEEKLAGIKSDIEDVKSIKKTNVNISEFSMKLEELETKVMDLNVRVGALEKAFKQMLPSLVENIHSLSRIIHELKNSHEELRGHVFGRESFHRTENMSEAEKPEIPVQKNPPQPNPQPAQKEHEKEATITDEEIKKILVKN